MASKPRDPRGGHIRVYWTLLDSYAYLATSNSARALYVDLRRKLGATNNGNVECTLATLRHRGWTAPSTLFRALQELVAVGLLAQTRQGGIAAGKKCCSLYRFTDEQVYEHPKLGVAACKADHQYQRFETLAHARAELSAMRQGQREKAAIKKNAKLQKLYRVATETVSTAPIPHYRNDTRQPRTSTKTVLVKNA